MQSYVCKYGAPGVDITGLFICYNCVDVWVNNFQIPKNYCFRLSFFVGVKTLHYTGVRWEVNSK